MKANSIVIEKTFDAPVSKVWTAITDKNEMRKWYFDLKEFKPVVGFEFRFYGGTEENQYLHICEITAMEFEKKLTYSWRYDGYAGISFVTFELFKEGEKTKLRLTHDGVESFPADNSDFVRSNFVEGWTSLIQTSLKEYLEGK